jgi:hypothetical protein
VGKGGKGGKGAYILKKKEEEKKGFFFEENTKISPFIKKTSTKKSEK